MLGHTLHTIAAGCFLAFTSFTPLGLAAPIAGSRKIKAAISIIAKILMHAFSYIAGTIPTDFVFATVGVNNAYLVPTLTITKWLTNPDLVLATATYNTIPAFLKCSFNPQAADNEKKAYTVIEAYSYPFIR
jgi:hypothetical protein